ncbi:hypothetical protein O3P69_018180 [Scylla paramamosain]|uniref:Uncharacterized protein n=1 Tax=Scylla paramamosain TaxID=85552 RepID=A0AAW0TI71_SCYPA
MSSLVDYAPITNEKGLETSILGLHFRASSNHLKHGMLKLRCTATIAAVYYRENTCTAGTSVSQLSDIHEIRSLLDVLLKMEEAKETLHRCRFQNIWEASCHPGEASSSRSEVPSGSEECASAVFYPSRYRGSTTPMRSHLHVPWFCNCTSAIAAVATASVFGACLLEMP